MARVRANLPTKDGTAPPTVHRSDKKGRAQTMPDVCVVHATSTPPNPPSASDQSPALPHSGHDTGACDPAQAATHPVAANAQSGHLGGTASIGFEGERLAILAGALGARLDGWKWLPTYKRWRGGQSVTAFHRKMLAIMLARLRNPALDWEECARAKALPERSRP